MKNLIKLSFTMILFISLSCSNDKEVTIENDINLKKTIQTKNNVTFQPFDLFKKSEDFKLLKTNFPKLINNLDLISFREHIESGIYYYNIKSTLKDKYIGSITFFKNNINEYYVKVETYNYDFKGEVASLDIKSKEGELIYSLIVNENERGNKFLVVDEKTKLKTITTSSRRGWFTCTKECAVDAISACYSDGYTEENGSGCSGWCTVLLATCWDAIGTTCAIWCAIDTDNDLTPNQP